MKRTIIAMALVVSVIISLRSPDAWACACAPPPEPRQALEGSEYVFHGIPDIFEKVGSDLLVTFEVIAVWKGPVVETLSVIADREGLACGNEFDRELEYIVYAESSSTSQPWAHACTRTRVYSAAEAEALGDPLPPPTSFSFRRGDANADGRFDLSDSIRILNFLFLGGEGPPCMKSADIDATGSIDISDAVFWLNYLFLGGPAPPVPFENCGRESFPDDLSCDSYPPCM